MRKGWPQPQFAGPALPVFIRPFMTARLVLSLLGLCALSAPAAGQAIPAQTFRPSPHPQDYFSVQSSRTLGHLHWGAGLYVNYAQDPLTWRVANDKVRAAVSDQLTANLQGALGVTDFLEIALDLPVQLYMAGTGLPKAPNGVAMTGAYIDTVRGPRTAGVGDLGLSVRGHIYEYAGFGLAAAAFLTAPTGKQVERTMGAQSVTGGPLLILEYRWPGWLRTAVNIGYRFAAETNVAGLQVDDEIFYRLGVGVHPATRWIEILAELYGAAGANSPLKANERQLEVLLGAKAFPIDGLQVSLAGGAGLLKGYGTPQWRVLAGVGYHFDRARKPTPPPDKDGDGLPDVNDSCPNDPEDVDGFQDLDGCPDPDNDGDGLSDLLDRCPNEAEDRDGFQDEDGCPEPDNDGDGILDAKDRCPNEPEDVNQCNDDDGCPEKGLVCLSHDRIIILDRIYFEFGKPSILERSYPVLNEVAKILKQNVRLRKVRIEGHTDDVGSNAKNMNLSKRRAKAVYDFFGRVGVATSRLSFAGYGETRPLVPNDSDENREKNRRVEFIIVEADPEPAVPPVPAPAP